jgi:hypothetical protein
LGSAFLFVLRVQGQCWVLGSRTSCICQLIQGVLYPQQPRAVALTDAIQLPEVHAEGKTAFFLQTSTIRDYQRLSQGSITRHNFTS